MTAAAHFETSATTAAPACPVCHSGPVEAFLTVGGRVYLRCGLCQARFLDPGARPTREEEYARYCEHENPTDDPGYRGFLWKLAEPLLARLPAGAHGLDYGCGPGPALAAMLREAGHSVALYDSFFQPDPAPLAASYDFVTCTETAEHFHAPGKEFDRLMGLIRPGGWLAVQTCFQRDDSRFRDWHYRRDSTHVVFYREATLAYLAEVRGWSCLFPVKDVALMQRPGSENSRTQALRA